MYRQSRRQKSGSTRLFLIHLEPRLLLSTTVALDTSPTATSNTIVSTIIRPIYEVLTPTLSTFAGSATASGFSPAQLRTAYGLDQTTFSGSSTAANGANTTIAIVDAYNDPNLVSDLTAFSTHYGIAAPNISIVSQTGSTTLPGVDPAGPGNSNWEGETILDVEVAHGLAPNAKILLVEATNDSSSNLFDAVSYAASVPGVDVVSMSWGGNETSSETSFDSLFTTPSGHTPVTFVAATGDAGEPGSYPAFSPNVVAVGGTALSLDSNGNYASESGWSGSGGGVSTVEAQPTYQKGVVTQSSTNRATPDLAADASPSTGFAVYDTYNDGTSTPWVTVGGTSLATPIIASVLAIADQGRLLAAETTLSSNAALTLLYSAPASDFHDITTGNNGFAAGAGYDLVTGRGSPRANALIPYLVTGTTPTPPPGTTPTIGSLTASPTTVSSGGTITLTANDVTDSASTDLTVTFYEETNDTAGLQTSGDYAIATVTDGSNSVQVDTSGVTGTFTFYAQVTDDLGNASATGTAAPSVTVTITAATSSRPTIAAVTATPNPIVTGDTLTLTATGLSDASGTITSVTFYQETNNETGLQTGYFGDTAFPSTNASDNFSLQVDTTGAIGTFTFYAVAKDNRRNTSATGTLAPSVSVTIVSAEVPAAPTALLATAISPTEIDLSFQESSTSQIGFTIQRATTSDFSNAVNVFTINTAAQRTYDDTGLAQDTTYYYRVQAFNLAGQSDWSDSASAATPISQPVNSTDPGTLTAVYRLYSPITHEHLLTTDPNEYAILAGRDWNQEGSPFSIYNGPITLDGVTAVPLYRLYDPIHLQHLYTTDFNEYTILKAGIWNSEGIEGYIFPTQIAATEPLFRLNYPNQTDLHLWTTDPNEYAVLAGQDGWLQEGIIGYVIANSET